MTITKRLEKGSGLTHAELDNNFDHSAKAWAYYDGANNVLKASKGIVSVTKNGTGHYTFTLETQFDDENYAVVAGSSVVLGNTYVPSQTASTFDVKCVFISHIASNTAVDANIHVSVFGA